MNLKEFFKNNQSDTILLISVILISLISFGAGRLTAPQPEKEPLVIDESQAAGISTFFTANSAQDQSTADAQNQPNEINTNQNKNQGQFVASKSGAVYHWPWCSWAQKIKPENQVWFTTEQEAQAAGYKRCSKFLELAPADYHFP